MSKASSILGSLSQMIRDGIHTSAIFALKANRTIGFLRRNLYACPQEVAYNPVLEYSGSVWDHSGVGLQNELRKVQNRAARFVTETTALKLGARLAFLNIWNGNPSRNGGETVDSYCYTKVWRVKPVYQQMTLSPWLGAAGMIILWHIRSPLLPLIFISVAFSPRPLGTVITSRLSYLLSWRCRGWCC